MPQQYVLHHPPPPPTLPLAPPPSSVQQQQPYGKETYVPNDSSNTNTYDSLRQPMYNNYPQYTAYSPAQAQTQLQPPNNISNNNNNSNNSDFRNFYGPVS